LIHPPCPYVFDRIPSHHRFPTYDTRDIPAPVLAFCRCMFEHTEGQAPRTGFSHHTIGSPPTARVGLCFWFHSVYTAFAGHGGCVQHASHHCLSHYVTLVVLLKHTTISGVVESFPKHSVFNEVNCLFIHIRARYHHSTLVW
jgi:hypothetical protein